MSPFRGVQLDGRRGAASLPPGGISDGLPHIGARQGSRQIWGGPRSKTALAPRTTFDHEDVALFGEWSFLLMRGVQLVVGTRWQHMEEDANSDQRDRTDLLYGDLDPHKGGAPDRAKQYKYQPVFELQNILLNLS